MSAGAVIQAAMVAALRQDLNDVSVFDAPPVRGAIPHVVVEPPTLAHSRVAGAVARDGRLVVSAIEAGERPMRLNMIVDVIEAVALPDVLDGDWRVTVLRIARSRLVRSGKDRWTAQVEFAVRLWKLGDE